LLLLSLRSGIQRLVDRIGLLWLDVTFAFGALVC
jgi:hypothetical protein